MFEKFKTMDEVNAYLGSATIECLFCGNHYQQLGNHILRAHAIDCVEYKEHFGIPRSRKLVSAPLHEKLSAATARRIAAQGEGWLEEFMAKGAAARDASTTEKRIAHVPAVRARLKETGLAGVRASHEKMGGKLAMVRCPDCSVEHQVSAWAATRKGSVLCPPCKQAHIRHTSRNRPDKAARSARQEGIRRARIANGEIISVLARDIFDFVNVQSGPVTTAEIIAAVWPGHPEIKRVNFKKRISDLLNAGRLKKVRPGVYFT